MSLAVEIDTAIALKMDEVEAAAHHVQVAARRVRESAGQREVRTVTGRTSSYEWTGTFADALVSARAALVLAHTAAADTLRTLKAEQRALEAQYTGWSRFFLVTNSNGHIHSSLNCHTCFATTTYRWVTSLSGQSEAETVAELGEILCSVCYPSAPVAWTTGVAKATQTARSERDAKKAAAAAKKAEKALLPDGSDLRVTYDRIGTLAAAKMWLTDCAMWTAWSASEGRRHPSYSIEDEQKVAEAVAAKTGETVAEVLAAAAKRAAKRK